MTQHISPDDLPHIDLRTSLSLAETVGDLPILANAAVSRFPFEVVDMPLSDRVTRDQVILAVRKIDRPVTIDHEDVLGKVADYFIRNPERRVDPTLEKSVRVEGLACGHTLPELLGAFKTEGAEVLLLHDTTQDDICGYFTYFTGKVPNLYRGLAKKAETYLPQGTKFKIADTVVNLNHNCHGGYKFMLAQCILECREKCPGAKYLISTVRCFPYPNEAMEAHEKLGWSLLRKSKEKGDEVISIESYAPDALRGENCIAQFYVVKFDLHSYRAKRIVAAARVLTRKGLITLDDRDGQRRTWPEEK